MDDIMLNLQLVTKVNEASGETRQMMKIAKPKAILTSSVYRFFAKICKDVPSHVNLTVVGSVQLPGSQDEILLTLQLTAWN